ncbi:hypothetical protein BV898_14056 [Hypsibius exemplaris]|uniref:Uncharacterized protein n=1 Tax=Hypsibius exemplaris TaxID=2072580 RepID=A0A1W0W8U3_HYPEX|nr:hypothetical protein BV898_14056 [Hypsibius exemplaris]
MSSSVSQGQGQSKVTLATTSAAKKATTSSTAEVQAQLKEIRQRRLAYKEYQARVHTGRAKRDALLSETEHCEKDIENIETIAVYVRRKIEFYTVACAALQQEIADARNNADQHRPTDYLNEEWLLETNADLLAEITAESTVVEVANQEKLEELKKRAAATVEFVERKALLEVGIEELRMEARATVRNIQNVTHDRDDLRLFMHEHADRTFQTAGDHDSYTRRQETAQELRSLEHRITFVCELNDSKVKEICSAYRCWLARIRKDNSVLYETVAAAWRWTPKSRLAKSCRRVKHKIFHQAAVPEQAALLDDQAESVEKMLILCDLQRDNFELSVKLSYSELVAHFLRILRIVTEDQTAGRVT